MKRLVIIVIFFSSVSMFAQTKMKIPEYIFEVNIPELGDLDMRVFYNIRTENYTLNFYELNWPEPLKTFTLKLEEKEQVGLNKYTTEVFHQGYAIVTTVRTPIALKRYAFSHSQDSRNIKFIGAKIKIEENYFSIDFSKEDQPYTLLPNNGWHNTVTVTGERTEWR